MDQPHIPKGPEPVVSTLNRSSDTTSLTLLPFSIAVFALALLGSLIILIQFTSVAAQEEEMSQALTEQKTVYDSKADIAVKVRDVGTLTQTLEKAYAAQMPFKDVLDIIEQTSYKQAKYDIVSIKSTGLVSLTGVVSRYSDFAQLVKALKDTDDGAGITKNVDIGTIGQSLVTEASGETVTESIQTKFNVSFTVKPELFAEPATFGGYKLTPVTETTNSETTTETTSPTTDTTTEPTTEASPATSETTETGATDTNTSDLSDIFNESAETATNPPTNTQL